MVLLRGRGARGRVAKVETVMLLAAGDMEARPRITMKAEPDIPILRCVEPLSDQCLRHLRFRP